MNDPARMAPATKPTAPLDLKSASLTLVAVVLRSTDPAALGEELRRRVARQGEAFRHEPVVLDLGPLADADESPDWPAVLDALRAEGLLPVAVKGGRPEQMAGALEAGLVDAGGGPVPARVAAPAADAPAEAPTAPAPGDAAAGAAADAAVDTAVDTTGVAQPSLFDAAPAGTAPSAAAPAADAAASTTAPDTASDTASATPDPAASPAPGRGPTVVIDRPLRSGQQVYARNADLVVMAVVSHGAEVIADGHIHVYAPLRGRAIAGARGDTAARIFAASMEPQLISIAGTWRTTETELPANVVGKPAQVRLEGDKLLVEPLGF